MLPQGSRCRASARQTRTPACASAASTVTPMARVPQRCARRCAARSAFPSAGSPSRTSPSRPPPTAPPPAVTSSRARCGRRPNASCAQKATSATEYSATASEKKVSDRSRSDWSGVTRGDLRLRCGAGGERGPQVVGEGGEPWSALAAAPRERGQRQHGTAAAGGGGGPGEDPFPAQQQQPEQAGEQRDGRDQHPHLAGVVRVL